MKTKLSAFAAFKSSNKKTHIKRIANEVPTNTTPKSERKRRQEKSKKLSKKARKRTSTTPSPNRSVTSFSNGLECSPPLTPTNLSLNESTKKMSRKKKKKVKNTSTPNGVLISSTSPVYTPADNNVEIPRISTNYDEILPMAITSDVYMFDSRIEGERCFEWLIHPFNKEKFFSEIWERKPLLLRRQNHDYYRELFSTSQLDLILREKCLWFGKNVDVTTYLNGQRETHNPPGRAHPTAVWDYFQNGCSVRLLNPQTFARSIWKLNVTLQEAFGCFVGANVYLTPAGSQGFAPHYDDIEAFVLQLEGKKRWKLYHPRKEEDVLPRTSSENFREEDLDEPILDVELKAGDLLYFPRGIIHQACTTPDTHSLHLTVSTCQRTTWGDLFEKLVPRMLQLAIEKDVEFRMSLPRDYMRFMGIANSELTKVERNEFEAKTRELFTRLSDCLPIDAAADQMAKSFIHDALPPLLTKEEKSRTIFANGERWTHQGVVGSVELDPDTKVKLLRANLIRLVMEEDGVNLYHAVDNSREYHADKIQSIAILPENAPAIEFLIHAYPSFVDIESLPLETLEAKMEVATLLYDKGLLITEKPLEPVDDQ